ncbi:hypothetical protein P0Y35_08635 [Kiritimatiellaeota bacterium B1221]|nr:hypothetical protein [Kiritimatiellaeota bacterium B1221]
MSTFEDKLSLVMSAEKAFAGGASLASVAEALGVPASSLSRYMKAYREQGPEGLRSKHRNCGRKAIARSLSGEAAEALQALCKRVDCKADALKFFSQDKLCPADVREVIQRCLATRKPFPPSLLRAARVTFEEVENRKGAKHGQYVMPVRFRDAFELMPDGTERRIEAGDWWELDDMSSNQPFWFECAPGTVSRNNSGDRLLEKFGCAIGRQGLYAKDVRGKWLGVELIGRPRDAYTAEDILRFLRRLMLEYGKPRRGLRIERGVWRSRAVAGHIVMDDAEEEKIILGLKEMGIELVYCWSSRQKGGIEGGFHHLQTDASLMIDSPDIGRSRGEDEAGTKALLRAKAGTKHPKELGFLHINELAEEWKRVLVARNMDMHTGRIAYGVPDVEWMKAVTADPLPILERDEMRAFLPWRQERVLQLGNIKLTIDGDEWLFDTSDLPRGFGKGDRVIVAVDPTDPALGAAIYNANSSKNSPIGYNAGAFLGWAELQDLTPQFGAQYMDRRPRRKVKFKSFMAAYASTGIMGMDARGAQEVRDGKGNVAKVETGVPAEDSLESDERNVDFRGSETPVRSRSEGRKKVTNPAQKRGGFADPLMAMILGEDD